jgi:hypothetical protein
MGVLRNNGVLLRPDLFLGQLNGDYGFVPGRPEVSAPVFRSHRPTCVASGSTATMRRPPSTAWRNGRHQSTAFLAGWRRTAVLGPAAQVAQFLILKTRRRAVPWPRTDCPLKRGQLVPLPRRAWRAVLRSARDDNQIGHRPRRGLRNT